MPGYERDQFGQTWTDDHAGRGGHNGCDTRNDVLAAQLAAVQYRARSRCVVIAGTLLTDPYTGRRIEFRKAAATKVQIDHLYPLARAWDMGAAHWSLPRRVDFANDGAANLLAVDGPANASKNDDGSGEWLLSPAAVTRGAYFRLRTPCHDPPRPLSQRYSPSLDPTRCFTPTGDSRAELHALSYFLEPAALGLHLIEPPSGSRNSDRRTVWETDQAAPRFAL
ncbi:HNH endonuclease family protein [Kribbella sp. NBC_00359]|uniref:HNH endonuclease family protein n=1 Tax=Kribbella sp. NBC_00359 TaxID=2975966 RepID=UPI002E1E6CC7